MGRAVFLSCCLTWGQTMVEVVKIMETSFKRSHACTAELTAPDPAAGYRQPMPPPEIPGHSWASLGHPLVGSLFLFPGSWCTQAFVCTLQESVCPVLCKFWWLCGGLMATSSKRAYAIPMSAAPRAPVHAAGHSWSIPPQETQTVLAHLSFTDYAKAFDCVDHNKLENSERDGNTWPASWEICIQVRKQQLELDIEQT